MYDCVSTTSFLESYRFQLQNYLVLASMLSVGPWSFQLHHCPVKPVKKINQSIVRLVVIYKEETDSHVRVVTAQSGKLHRTTVSVSEVCACTVSAIFVPAA